MDTRIIGIDVATVAKKTGIALGVIDGNLVHLEQVTIERTEQALVATIGKWISGSSHCLLAIDAPLGWPVSLGQSLSHHRAGAYLSQKPDSLFRRKTDLKITEVHNKRPLDVGADRIARTAHTALRLLHQLRDITHQVIPLAWSPKLSDRVSAIEVYPAATLIAHGLHASGYKGRKGTESRRILLDGLRSIIHLPEAATDLMVKNDDALDAVICLLAGADFLRDTALSPADIDLAKREGWIWVKQP